MSTYKLGQIPSNLSANASLNQGDLAIDFVSTSGHIINNLKLISSHYDDSGRYLDYSEISFDKLSPLEARREFITLDMPPRTSYSVGDISAVEQTWLNQHWQKLSTAGLVIWTLIILARRLA